MADKEMLGFVAHDAETLQGKANVEVFGAFGPDVRVVATVNHTSGEVITSKVGYRDSVAALSTQALKDAFGKNPLVRDIEVDGPVEFSREDGSVTQAVKLSTPSSEWYSEVLREPGIPLQPANVGQAVARGMNFGLGTLGNK